MKPFVFFIITFDPIKILTCQAFQNDCQNLIFMKAINVVAKKKWPKILVKWPFHIFVIFVSKQSLNKVLLSYSRYPATQFRNLENWNPEHNLFFGLIWSDCLFSAKARKFQYIFHSFDLSLC